MSMTAQTNPAPVAGTYQPKGMLIGGKWVGSISGAHFAVENPAKRTAITDVPRADAADVNIEDNTKTKKRKESQSKEEKIR